MLWIGQVKIPEISAYPLIDFAFKTKYVGGNEPPVAERQLFSASAIDAGSGDVVRSVGLVRIGSREPIKDALPLVWVSPRLKKLLKKTLYNNAASP